MASKEIVLTKGQNKIRNTRAVYQFCGLVHAGIAGISLSIDAYGGMLFNLCMFLVCLSGFTVMSIKEHLE